MPAPSRLHLYITRPSAHWANCLWTYGCCQSMFPLLCFRWCCCPCAPPAGDHPLQGLNAEYKCFDGTTNPYIGECLLTSFDQASALACSLAFCQVKSPMWAAVLTTPHLCALIYHRSCSNCGGRSAGPAQQGSAAHAPAGWSECLHACSTWLCGGGRSSTAHESAATANASKLIHTR